MNDIRLSFIFKNKHTTGSIVKDHSHSSTEIVYYISGNGQSIINGRSFEIRKNSLAVIKPGSIHSEKHCAESSVLFFGFYGDILFEEIEEGVFYPKQHTLILQIIHQILSEAIHRSKNHTLLIAAKICELSVLLSREYSNAGSDARNLSYCANYLCENCSEPVDMHLLAENFGYSYDYFRHMFKKEFGMSPQNFVIAQRLNNAYKMLTTQNISCTETAYYCGFSDSSQFSKMFKRNFGISPKKAQLKSKE